MYKHGNPLTNHKLTIYVQARSQTKLFLYRGVTKNVLTKLKIKQYYIQKLKIKRFSYIQDDSNNNQTAYITGQVIYIL